MFGSSIVSVRRHVREKPHRPDAVGVDAGQQQSGDAAERNARQDDDQHGDGAEEASAEVIALA